MVRNSGQPSSTISPLLFQSIYSLYTMKCRCRKFVVQSGEISQISPSRSFSNESSQASSKSFMYFTIAFFVPKGVCWPSLVMQQNDIGRICLFYSFTFKSSIFNNDLIRLTIHAVDTNYYNQYKYYKCQQVIELHLISAWGSWQRQWKGKVTLKYLLMFSNIKTTQTMYLWQVE